MKVSMRVALILASLLLVWGTHLVLIPPSYLLSERILLRHARDIMNNISDLTMEQAFNHLEKAKSAASLARRLLTADVLRNDEVGSDRLERYFFDQLTVYPHLSGIYFGSPNGDFFYVSRNSSRIKGGFRTKIIRHRKGRREVTLLWRDEEYRLLARESTPEDRYDPRQRPWYIKAMREQRVVWTEPYIFYTSRRPGITIAGPVFAPDGSIKGIVGVDIGLAELSAFLDRLQVGKSGSACITNRQGRLIAYPDPDLFDRIQQPEEDYRLPLATEINDPLLAAAWRSADPKLANGSEDSVFSTFVFNGRRYLAMLATLPDPRLPWIIGVYLPEDDYLGELNRYRRYTLAATIAVSFLASWLGLLLARRITAPVERLREEARAITANDFDAPCQVHTGFVELQETADAFNRMQRSLVDYRERLQEQERLHRTITAAARDAILLVDKEGTVEFANPAAETLCARPTAELCSLRLADLIADGNRLLAPYRSHSEAIEIMVRTPQGQEVAAECSLAFLRIGNEPHMVLVVRDVRERQRHERLRQRLVRDLHDGIGANLGNIKLLAAMAKEGTGRTEQSLAAIVSLCDESMDEIRSYMDTLEDRTLAWSSFIAEIRSFGHRVLDGRNIGFSLEDRLPADLPPLSAHVALNLYRIVREAITNAARHANATRVWVTAECSACTIRIEISDNGRGIPDDARPGRGLASMDSRAAEIGGQLRMERRQGTRIIFEAPLSSLT